MASPSVCIICLIGLPASGKTTLARQIESKYKSTISINVISYDDVICWEDNRSWKEKRGFVRDAVVSLIEKHLLCLQRQNLIIILDDNMYYKSMRYEYYQLARKFQTGFYQIYVSTPLHICLELNRRRNIPVPENTILKINNALEIPDPSKNSWEKNSLFITSSLNFNEMWNTGELIKVELMVQQCFSNSIQQVPKCNNEYKSLSSLHLADLALRKLVNVLIVDIKDKCNNSETCKELMTNRKFILEKVRSGELTLPDLNQEENAILCYSEFLRPHLMNKEKI